jgi:hypothetical protein
MNLGEKMSSLVVDFLTFFVLITGSEPTIQLITGCGFLDFFVLITDCGFLDFFVLITDCGFLDFFVLITGCGFLELLSYQ